MRYNDPVQKGGKFELIPEENWGFGNIDHWLGAGKG
jgi:hypothetical protein